MVYDYQSRFIILNLITTVPKRRLNNRPEKPSLIKSDENQLDQGINYFMVVLF